MRNNIKKEKNKCKYEFTLIFLRPQFLTNFKNTLDKLLINDIILDIVWYNPAGLMKKIIQ